MPVSPLQQRTVGGVLNFLNTLNPFAPLAPGYTDTKPMPGETPFAYNHRMSVLQGARGLESAVGNVGAEVNRGASYIFGSEAEEQQKRATAKAAKPAPQSGAFPSSFSDPKYDELEKLYGGDVAPLLKQIRMQGERTNYGPQGDPRYQNARTGAYTPYQITSDTRNLFMKNPGYQFDPWSSPENAIKAAAQILRDHGGINNPRAAVAGYFGGARAAQNPDAAWGDGNLSVNQYVDRVLYGGGGQPGVLRNPFNPAFYNQANAQLDQATAERMSPTRSVFDVGLMPDIPKPEAVPKTDFSAAEANLEAMRPVEMAEVEAKDIQWKNFWSGIGRAMASSPSGEGLGSFFARMGGGALMGKGAAGDEIQQRKDAYDAKLARFNAALYEHNIAKAQTVHNELLMDWQANQQYIGKMYEREMGIFNRNSEMSLVDGQIVRQTYDPKTGQAEVTTTPVRSIIMADAARDKANLSMQAFGQQNQANSEVAALGNRAQAQIVMGRAAQIMADETASAQEKSAAAAFGHVPAIKYAIDTGQVGSVIGGDTLEAMHEEITTELSPRLDPGTKEYDAAYREALMGRMIMMTQDPATLQRLMSTFGQAADLYGAYQQSQNVTSQVRTKAGNQVFTTTQKPVEE